MNDKSVEQYLKTLEESIFTVMEMSKQSYPDIMCMPINRFENYMIWKSKLEEEKQKMIEEGIKNRGFKK